MRAVAAEVRLPIVPFEAASAHSHVSFIDDDSRRVSASSAL